jgi:L-alanine-DL-glutamate epimerase-like enolase superfamily enzyme
MQFQITVEHWPLKKAFAITNHVFSASEVLVVTVSEGGHTGRGEACGAYYKKETPEEMAQELRTALGTGCHIERSDLAHLQCTAGARNALDCALWDLEAKRTGRAVWQLAGLRRPRPLRTTYTLGADTPEQMAIAATEFADASNIKLKLTGDGTDDDRVRAVRRARPDVWLMVDANQGFTPKTLPALMPTLTAARVSLIEQPYAVGKEADLDDLVTAIPIAADESAQDVGDLAALQGRCQVINIKLDKCGGLTPALEMAQECRRLGFQIMVGNMMGTSLSVAPGYLLGQLCDFVDLDAALFLKSDRDPAATYRGGLVTVPRGLWGEPL